MSGFGDYIRRARAARAERKPRFSLRQVAQRVGLEPAYLSKVERGLVPPPSEATIVRLAAELGFPVVMKIVSPQILHKTDAGGVVVGVATADEAEQAYQTIVASAKRYDPKAQIEGVQVQQLAEPGTEVIVGAISDQSFGKLVAFGLGGILVEVLKDITFRLAPTSQADALDMLDSIQAREVLKGVRGAEPVDRQALAEIIVAVSQLVADHPEIVELDVLKLDT